MKAKKTNPNKKKQTEIEDLIQEAVVDCYGVEEEFSGIFSAVQDGVECPFNAKVIGEDVLVTELTISHKFNFGVKAVCQYKKKKFVIDLTSLEFTGPLPKGYPWVEAYIEWLRRF